MRHEQLFNLATAIAGLASVSLLLILPGMIANSSPKQFCLDSGNTTQLQQCKEYLRRKENGLLVNLTDSNVRNKFLDQYKMAALVGLAAFPLLLTGTYLAYEHSRRLALRAARSLITKPNKPSLWIQIPLYGTFIFFTLSTIACVNNTNKPCGSEQGTAGLITSGIFIGLNLKIAHEHKPTCAVVTCSG